MVSPIDRRNDVIAYPPARLVVRSCADINGLTMRAIRF